MRYIIIWYLCLCCFKSNSQKQYSLIDTTQFEIDTSIEQNGSTYNFWKGPTDSTIYKLCIERVCHNQDTLIFSDYIKDGEYNVYDVNDDGFADFVTYYHQYAYIHFFIPLRNSFKESEFIMPAEGSTIDKKKHIYCGFHETMYGDKYSYSILFKYKGTIPIFYYKLVFITTKEGYEQMDKVKQIKLYKFQDNDYTKPVFVENLKTNKLRNFDYESYWKAHLNTFIGSR